MFFIYRRIKDNQKAQVAPFLVLIAAILVLAIIATSLIGEATFRRLRLANITDSGAISAASAFCRGLNQIRVSNTQMLLSYIRLQVQLLAKSPWPSKAAGYSAALGWSLIGIESNKDLFDQADNIAKDLGKNLRANLYDSIFGAALIDEPKPFNLDEITRDASGKIVSIDYNKYIQRHYHFEDEYLNFKNGAGDYVTTGGKDEWWKQDKISYSFNKKKADVLNRPGKLSPGEEPDTAYASYLRTELAGTPSQVSVDPQRLVLFFFYCTPSGCWTPGIIPHPYAWIRRIDLNSDNFSLKVSKSDTSDLYGGRVTQTHTTNIRIKGSLYRGYDFVVE